MALRKFIIERDIPKVGTFEREQLRGAAAKSNGVLRQLGPDIQWVESYVADNKTFCVYLAKDEDIIRKHAEVSGFRCFGGAPPIERRTRRRTAEGGGASRRHSASRRRVAITPVFWPGSC